MKELIVPVICLCFLFFTTALHASEKITYLSIKENMVHFSTAESKTESSPTCMASENANIWVFSLNEVGAEAKLSILTTALASNLSISVKTANDCAAKTGFERPNQITYG